MGFFSKKVLIGLDIGEHSLKAAVINPENRVVIDLAELELFPDRKLLVEKPDENTQVEFCKKIVEKYINPWSEFQPIISASIQGDGAIGNYLEFPSMEKKKLETAIQTATQEVIPFPTNETTIDYIPVPSISREKKNTNAFFTIAIKKNAIKKIRRLMENCNLASDNLDVYALPLIRSFASNHAKVSDKFVGLIHLGSRLTSVVVIRDGYPYFMWNFPIAGFDFTYAFQMAMQSSWQEAEKYKLDYDVMTRQIPFEPILIRWKDQVKNSLDNFIKLHKNINPRMFKVFLSGGSAQMKGLDKFLSESLNLPVAIDNWDKMKPEKDLQNKFIGAYNIAIGLSL
jgi:type IV pilus assembly protein PilM